MSNFILCAFCGALVAYNSYFSGYECSNCGAFTPKQDYKQANICISPECEYRQIKNAIYPECELKDCPVGLFLYNGELCLKTEYALDSYIVSSGEMFWGGVSNREDLAHVKVRPYMILGAYDD